MDLFSNLPIQQLGAVGVVLALLWYVLRSNRQTSKETNELMSRLVAFQTTQQGDSSKLVSIVDKLETQSEERTKQFVDFRIALEKNTDSGNRGVMIMEEQNKFLDKLLMATNDIKVETTKTGDRMQAVVDQFVSTSNDNVAAITTTGADIKGHTAKVATDATEIIVNRIGEAEKNITDEIKEEIIKNAAEIKERLDHLVQMVKLISPDPIAALAGGVAGAGGAGESVHPAVNQ